jgi:nitrosocyanin
MGSGKGHRAGGIAVGLLAFIALAGSGCAAHRARHAAAEKAPGAVQMTVVGVEYEGTKLWVPGTIVVHKGDHVKLNLINKIPSDPPNHGFAIDAFNVKEVVNRGEPKSVEFVADKVGVFPIYCQLHPAHVGGQLVVLCGGKPER